MTRIYDQTEKQIESKDLLDVITAAQDIIISAKGFIGNYDYIFINEYDICPITDKMVSAFFRVQIIYDNKLEESKNEIYLFESYRSKDFSCRNIDMEKIEVFNHFNGQWEKVNSQQSYQDRMREIAGERKRRDEQEHLSYVDEVLTNLSNTIDELKRKIEREKSKQRRLLAIREEVREEEEKNNYLLKEFVSEQ